MGVDVRRSDDGVRVTVAGAADVRVASDLKQVLVDALDGSRPVVVDLTGASTVDAAFLQLSIAAEHSFNAHGVPLSIEGADVLAAALPGVPAERSEEEEHDAR